MSHAEVFRGDKVHVLADKCATCIFRPGNLMQLEAGRVKGMVDTCLKNDGVIPCHSTIHTDEVEPAVCRGFFDSYANDIFPLRLAKFTDNIEYDPVPEK